MTDPTTQAGTALLDDIGQLVRTIRIAAKVPDSEIVPGATREHFLERIAAIEAEAAATARAKALIEGSEADLDETMAAYQALYRERDAAQADVARLRNAVDAAVQNIAHDRVGAAVAGLRAALAATLDTDKWLAEREEKLREKWLAEHNELFAPFVERTVANYLAAHPNLLDLASPEAEQRLAAALFDTRDELMALFPASAFQTSARAILSALRSQAASQPAEPVPPPADDSIIGTLQHPRPAEPVE